MKRKLKCISLNYVLPSDRTLDILEIGPLYNKHTQLNVCEKEELRCAFTTNKKFGNHLFVSTVSKAALEKKEA